MLQWASYSCAPLIFSPSTGKVTPRMLANSSVFCPRAPNAARTAWQAVCKLRKERKGTRRRRQHASSGGQRNHLWLSQGLWPSSAPVAGADRTRPVSWLGSISFGAHPRTKGARYFTGGHRRRAPSSPKGLLTSRMQGARRPFGPDVESADQQAVLSGRSGKHLQSSRRRESQERDMPLQKAGTCLGRPAGSGAMA